MTMYHQTHMQTSDKAKTIHSYCTGLMLSLLLTFAAFSLVQLHVLSYRYLYTSLAILAVMQLLVQSVCFLRLNGSTEGRWNLLPFLFTIMIIAILAGGSFWIMFNLNYNMSH